ncbi:MAG: DUF1592 domain-containing protein [Fimbriimonadaceae bacterium]|nr:DUF1592 domain-containing protein [Fimbriimonadaceae bacterium]
MTFPALKFFRHWPTGLLLLSATLFALQSPAQQKQPTAPTGPSFEKEIQPLITKLCVKCHTGATPAAGLNLASFKTEAQVLKGKDAWEKVSRNVSSGHMPPMGSAQPTKVERQKIVEYIDKLLSRDCVVRDPGRVTIRRLNRTEYNNTIRDLLGVPFTPADDFPADDVGYGFDNIADVLSISPLLMEKYLDAAEKITEKAIVVQPVQTRRYSGDELAASSGVNIVRETIAGMYSAGSVTADHDFKKAGTYKIKIVAFGDQAGPEPAKMAVKLGNQRLTVFDVKATPANPSTYELPLEMKAGKVKISAEFINDYYQPQDPDPKNRDRNLYVASLEIIGPIEDMKPIPESHRRLIFVQPTPGKEKEAATQILNRFASRAWRRPATTAEVERLTRFVDMTKRDGAPFEKGIQLAVQAVLVSPSFLFRLELDERPTDLKVQRTLNNYELASRLSYFLWSSMPDDELYKLAEQGKLSDPAVLEGQTLRMLKDPKARALADNFASQWLEIRKLNYLSPDAKLFPEFSEQLRKDMWQETLLFFDHIVRQDRPILEFLDSKYTFLNERLANLYGIAGVTGNQFRMVTLKDAKRGGVLTQASVLTITSNPTRTSPVKRGKWVLEQILGTPPPPPPPGVGNLSEERKKIEGKTIRQRLEQHRSDPACANCHKGMDTLGFGLENFNAIGQWRTSDEGMKIDSAGAMPDGAKFKGPTDLKVYLLAKKPQFVRAFGEKMLIYALGRGLTSADKCHIDEIAKAAEGGNYRMSTVILAVVKSDAFRKRRGDGGR